jgi:hypothetical protein
MLHAELPITLPILLAKRKGLKMPFGGLRYPGMVS